MLNYILRRLVYTVIVLWLVSIVAFVIIQLPPGDYVSSIVLNLQDSGQLVSQDYIESLKRQYGLDLPIYRQYLRWIGGFFRGDFGRSFDWDRPVAKLIGDRFLFTIILSCTTILFTYAVAIPIGIYSATHQYSLGDYAATTLGFIGLATPNFLLALILMIFFYSAFGISPGGLFSPEFANAPWSIGRLIDLARHLPIPVVVVGTAGTAGLIRVMRGMLLDELKKQYVVTARAKGVSERRLLFKYPVRMAMNPIVSTVAGVLPQIISGGSIVAIVLSLPTIGPLLLNALLSEDMYLAATLFMFVSSFSVIGIVLSDILLAALDPRIRFEKSG